MNFSDEIRLAIVRSGLGVCELARRAGVDAAIISRFIHGRRGMELNTLDAIARALDLHLAPRPKRQRTKKGRREHGHDLQADAAEAPARRG